MAKKKTTAQTKKAADKDMLNKIKMEAAEEVGVNLNQERKLTKKQSGAVGGQMVKKMVEKYKKETK